MIDQDKLKTVLKVLPIDKPEIDVVGTPPGLIATVTSDSFSTMHEGQCQALVRIGLKRTDAWTKYACASAAAFARAFLRTRPVPVGASLGAAAPM